MIPRRSDDCEERVIHVAQISEGSVDVLLVADIGVSKVGKLPLLAGNVTEKFYPSSDALRRTDIRQRKSSGIIEIDVLMTPSGVMM